jgi:hypothetical protein
MIGLGRRARAWILIVLICACLASEQVLLLSEPGSGAHSFAASLASEAQLLRGHDFVIAWGVWDITCCRLHHSSLIWIAIAISSL